MNSSRAATMAYRCLLRQGTGELPVQPLDMLRCCRDTRVMPAAEAAELLQLPISVLEQLFDGTDAWTYRYTTAAGQVCYLVVYQTGGHPARLRFSLAHELAHRVLGHTGMGEQEEREADRFASYLLCPRPVVRCLTADEVARKCYVSKRCAEYVVNEPEQPVDQELEHALEALFCHTEDHERF